MGFFSKLGSMIDKGVAWVAFGGSNPSLPTQNCGSSSVDRALAFQAEGRGFESRLPLSERCLNRHLFFISNIYLFPPIMPRLSIRKLRHTLRFSLKRHEKKDAPHKRCTLQTITTPSQAPSKQFSCFAKKD